MPPVAQNDSRLPVLLIIIFILWAFPDPAPAPLTPGTSVHNTFESTLARELKQLHVVNNTGYGAFAPKEGKWVNITGLEEEDGFAWDVLESVKGRVRQQVGYVVGNEEEAGRVIDGGGVGVELPVWKNVSGHVRGKWVRSALDREIEQPKLNMSRILPWDARDFRRRWERNVTGQEGELRIDLSEKGMPDEVDGVRLQNVKAELSLQDVDSAGDGWGIVMYGTHFVDAGSIILTTTSTKFAGMWALPQFALSEKTYGLLRGSVVERIQDVMRKQKNYETSLLHPYTSMPEGRVEDAYTPRCELIAYLQQHPLVDLQPDGQLFTPSPSTISEMEEELRHPAGARPYSPPPLRLSATIFSPDCGFVIESKGPPEYAHTDPISNHLTGEKWESYIRSSISVTLLFGLTLAGQILLTISQMKASSTPSTRSRISFWTVGIMSLGDGFVGMAFLPLGMLIDAAFPALMGTAFFAFLAVTFFDVRFLLEVWSVQVQERERAERLAAASTPAASASASDTPASGAQAQAPIITAAGADTLPLPVTARSAISSGATPLILPPSPNDTTPQQPQQEPQSEATRHRRELGSLYGKFYLCLLVLVFLSLHATGWYPRPRAWFTNTLSFAYLSLWIPQIWRNTMRNCRKALTYRFVLGQSVCRVLPVGYFYTIRSNVLWVHNDKRVFAVLVGWVWIQICILVVQDVLGPRVGVPRSWVPRAYDYHPVLREDDEEGGVMPIGFAPLSPTTTATTAGLEGATRPPESKDKNKRIFDCAICMQNIEVPVVPAGGGEDGARESVKDMVQRRLYMLTPCRHIFHTKCLEAAMRYRLQCPVCREGLPPL